jgi:preprotein translocase subunit SecA
VDDSVPIEAGLINRSIEGAQTRVEGYNFDVRKHTVEFDDVMNKQRTVIYADRRAILEGQNMRDRILEMIEDEVQALIDRYLPEGKGRDEDFAEWDAEALLRATRAICPQLPAEITAEQLEQLSRQEALDTLVDAIEMAYEAREQAIGEENMRYVERRMMLGAIDRQWVDYLTGMEDLRQEIGLQSIAQRDPLIEYQRNAFDMFDQLKANIQRDITYHIIPVSFQYEQSMRQVEAEQQKRLQMAQRAGQSEEQARAARTVRTAVQLPGRNDPCPCGSGKKFKQCHLERVDELLAMMQSGTVQAPARAQSPSVAAQVAGAPAQRPATSAAPRGRAAPPATPATPKPAQTNGKSSSKPQAQAPRGKGQTTKKK